MSIQHNEELAWIQHGFDGDHEAPHPDTTNGMFWLIGQSMRQREQLMPRAVTIAGPRRFIVDNRTVIVKDDGAVEWDV